MAESELPTPKEPLKIDQPEHNSDSHKGIQTDLEPQHGEKPSGFYVPYLIGSLVMIMLSLFLIGFFPRYFHSKTLNQAAALQELPKVVTMKLKEETKAMQLVLPSSLEAIRVTPIWARVDGYLKQFFVDIGDHVKEGDLLAVIETPEIDQQVDQAKAELASAVSKREIASISAERWQDLYKHNPQAISSQEVDERKATYTSTTADVNSAEANLKRLQETQEFKNILAPFDGVIIERDIDMGSLITAGSNGTPQQLFKIAKEDVLRVFVNVPQYYFRSIHNGLTADVIIREFPERVFKGVVARNARALDPTARTLLTEVHIDNKEGILFPGLYAMVNFNLVSDTVRFIVPTAAVIIRADTPQLALVNAEGIVQLKPVRISLDKGSQMEIMDGLKEGDEIVINPNEKIKDGVKIQVLDSNN